MKRSFLFGLTLVLATFLCASRAGAQTRDCDSLRGARRELAFAILKTQHAYSCCDRTLEECLRRKPVCRVVERLDQSGELRRRAGPPPGGGRPLSDQPQLRGRL